MIMQAHNRAKFNFNEPSLGKDLTMSFSELGGVFCFQSSAREFGVNESKQTPGGGEGPGGWCTAVHGGHKESHATQRLNNSSVTYKS